MHRRRPAAAAAVIDHRAGGDQRQGQAAALCADEPYMAGIFGVEAGGRDRRTTSDLMSRYGAKRPHENTSGCWRRAGGSDSTRGIYGFSGNVRQWLVNSFRCRLRREIENIVTVALDIGERSAELEMAQGQGRRRNGVAELARDPEFRCRAGKARRIGRLVAGVAPSQQPGRQQPDVASSLERNDGTIADEVAAGNLKRSSLNEFWRASRDASSQLVANPIARPN